MTEFREGDREDSRLREHLRRAVRSDAAPPDLDARIRSSIRDAERLHSWGRRWLPVAAAVAVCMAGVAAYERGHLRYTDGSQESYIVSVSNRVAERMRAGLGDHIHCAVFRKLPNDAPPVEALASEMGAEYRGLIPMVRERVPNDYRLVVAHECRYRGRKFVHLSLKGDGRLVSLVITRKQQAESFAADGLPPALSQSGIPLYRAGVQRFEIASFESRDHLVYFVSDLPERDNMRMMAAVAPGVKDYLRGLEL